MSPYRDPELWEEAKAAARKRLGGHSARAMQLAGELYRRAGGRYQGRKTAAQRSLTRWTGQDWTTRSGRPSRETGERYLPRKVIEKLTPAEYAATTRAKRKGTKQGKQYVPQPPKIRAKVARLKREDNLQSNPRPKLYASAAERQAALRARSPTLQVRLEPTTAESIKRIADASGRTVQETLASMIAFALANRNWTQLGLTSEGQVPYYKPPRKDNPMARTPTPAQIAARERFAEMARSGAFKRKARSNPRKRGDRHTALMPQDKTVYKRYTIIYPRSGGDTFYIVRDNTNIGSARSLDEAKGIIDMLTEGSPNPRPKVTVGDKISQLMDEGYPQKQAVAIALNEQRAGKVKPNPRAPRRPGIYMGADPGNYFAQSFSMLDDIDFESPYFRERRVTPARALKANAMLDKILDQMEKIAKIING